MPLIVSEFLTRTSLDGAGLPKKEQPITMIKTAWRKALHDAGIPYLNFLYAGHHTFGTRAIDNSAPVSAVKEVLKYMDIKTTMRYVQATDEEKR
jgi:hypothetical protein